MLKILLLHNVLAPYRLELFEYMSLKCKLDLYLINNNIGYRQWHNELSNNLILHYSKNKSINFFTKKIIYSINLKNITKYDVVILPDDKAYILPIIHLVKKLNKKQKLILWTANNKFSLFHDNIVLNFLLKFVFEKLRRLYLYNRADLFWAYGINCTNHLYNRFNISSKKIISGLQGYPMKNVFFNLKKINYENRFKSKSIVLIGYPSKRKNFEFFYNVFQKNKTIDFEVFCIGPIPKNKIEGVNYLGYFEKHEKYNLLNKFTYAVLPSKSEPWGWVVNECMSIGLPILVSEAVMSKEMIVEGKLIFKLEESSLNKSLDFIENLSFNNYVDLSIECIKSSHNHSLMKTKNSFDKILENV